MKEVNYSFYLLYLNFSMNSKKIFLGAVALFCTVTLVQAQTTPPVPRPGSAVPKPRAGATGVGVKDGLSMQNGRVVLTELGNTNPITADKKLLSGVIISPKGIVTATDGTTTQLNEGDVVSLTGRITTRTSLVEADSLLKIKLYDQKYPGKREKMEKERDQKAKEKIKRDEEKAKAKAKSKRR